MQVRNERSDTGASHRTRDRVGRKVRTASNTFDCNEGRES